MKFAEPEAKPVKHLTLKSLPFFNSHHKIEYEIHYEKVDESEADRNVIYYDVKGDGNCLPRAVQVLRGYDEETYMVLKTQVYQFARQHREFVEQYGDLSLIHI